MMYNLVNRYVMLYWLAAVDNIKSCCILIYIYCNSLQITAIIYSDDGTIGSIDATNLADAIKERKMRREEAQNLLDRLEAEKWISKVRFQVVRPLCWLSGREVNRLAPTLIIKWGTGNAQIPDNMAGASSTICKNSGSQKYDFF